MIISMTAYNRPEYLKPMLESLEEAIYHCEEAVFLVVAVDHSDKQDEILSLLPQGRRGTYLHTAYQNLGLQRNTLRALDEAWAIAERMSEDFVLHLEDDLVLAPDALKMTCFMRDEYRESQDTGFVSLTNVHNHPEPGKNGNCYRSPWFECHVWGTWKTIWDQLLRPEWPHDWLDHWAQFVNDHEMWGMFQVLPELSRSKSIGEFGVHSNSDYHKSHNPKVWAGDVEDLCPYTAEYNVPVAS